MISRGVVYCLWIPKISRREMYLDMYKNAKLLVMNDPCPSGSFLR